MAADFISRRALAPDFDGNQKSTVRLSAKMSAETECFGRHTVRDDHKILKNSEFTNDIPVSTIMQICSRPRINVLRQESDRSVGKKCLTTTCMQTACR